MAKDPAFLFYSSDFTVGTQFFTHEQTGKYIRLLCAQHQHGHLSEEDMMNICLSYDKRVFDKFARDEAGLFFNEVLEERINERKAFSKSRSDNRLKGLEKKKRRGGSAITSSSYDHHMEDENEIEDKEVIKKTKKDKPIKETKVEFAPDVKLTDAENRKLTDEHGFDLMNRVYNFLANYKIEKGYKTKSDYHTIIRWVIDAVKNKSNGQQTSTTTVRTKPLTGAQIILQQLNSSLNRAGTGDTFR